MTLETTISLRPQRFCEMGKKKMCFWQWWYTFWSFCDDSMVEMCVSHVYQNVPTNQLCPWRRAMAQDLGHSWHHILLDWSYKCWNRLHELVHTNLKAQSLSWIVTPPVMWRPDVSESLSSPLLPVYHHVLDGFSIHFIQRYPYGHPFYHHVCHGNPWWKIPSNPTWLARLCPSRRRISSGFRSLEFRMGKHGRLLTIILWYHWMWLKQSKQSIFATQENGNGKFIPPIMKWWWLRDGLLLV